MKAFLRKKISVIDADRGRGNVVPKTRPHGFQKPHAAVGHRYGYLS